MRSAPRWRRKAGRPVNREPFYVELGERIRALRLERNWSQEHVAMSLGQSRASMANIEAGRQRVYAHQILLLAALFDVEAAQLFAVKPQTAAQATRAKASIRRQLKAEAKRRLERYDAEIAAARRRLLDGDGRRFRERSKPRTGAQKGTRTT